MNIVVLRGAVVFLAGLVILLLFAVYEVPTHEGATQVLRTAGFQAFHEIGFALIVSAVVWFVFESFKEKTKEMGDSIFQSSRKLPIELIHAASELLDHNFIREKWECTFFLDLQEAEYAAGLRKNFVALQCTTAYTMRNITDRPQLYTLAVSVSGTRFEDLKHLVLIDKVYIKKGGIYNHVDTKEANEQLRKLGEHRRDIYLAHETIEPGQALDVALSYTKIKEAADTEIIASFYAADSLTFTLVDRTGGSIHVDASALAPMKAEAVELPEGANLKKFVVQKYMLPGQGFQFWWRTKD